MRILLARHGETPWNAEGRYQGQEDIALSPVGIGQAEALGRRLADVRIDRAVASPLQRARRTAELALGPERAGMLTLDPLEDGERGAIVNTASVAAEDGQIGQAAYSASKGGVYAMTLPVARDLAQEGIRCNTILPGIMWTPMMAGMDQKIQDALAAAIPFPSRLGTPADYASLVLELARNVYINGECIRLDGAIRLAPR